MTQLIIEGTALPEASRDRYSCPSVPLTVQVEMISGRTVTELRGGNVYKPSYQYDYLPPDIYGKVGPILISGQPFTASVLPNGAKELVTSRFLVESYTQPTFAFSKDGRPYWHGFAFTLREVKPHA